MSSLEELLGSVAPRLEGEVRSRLGGFLGGMVRHYLPQTWVFRTEAGVASLSVGPDGSVSVAPGALDPADVTVEVGEARLAAALRSDRTKPTPAGGVTVTTHTAKGKAAYGLLRDRLGL